ncbi:cupin domain-containing protein [Deinococcus koreensis]|uniref:Cupin domain-containing protein n=1 Tax=Deinococcus koreensis TaxID=2054903 RepID=A0A2K3UWZ8_9DEIO|nr:cupin domain-containing protein [Deinococcus koreensis]PNY81054.1 cupin domain-containing protein [Deinococcus koreensis]
MTQTSRYKLSQRDTTHGPDGEHHLIRGETGSMRLWHREEPNEGKPETVNDYETLGYVIEGRAELVVDGQSIALQPGDSYCVPRGASHTYRITETLTAVEVTSPATDK